jgi:hypothetical protein
VDAAEVTRLLEATRDDLVRDVLATLTDFRLRRLTPVEIDRLKRIALPHVHAAAIVATRYAIEKRGAPALPAPLPVREQGWTSEETSPGRPSAMPTPGRRRTD